MGARDDEGENVWLLQKKKKTNNDTKGKEFQDGKHYTHMYNIDEIRVCVCVYETTCVHSTTHNIYAYRRRNIQGDFCFPHKFFL